MNELQKETARAILNVFETGRVRGDYSGIAVIKGDSGHLSYGRSQAALGSGTLFELINEYCAQPNAQFAVDLREFLGRLQQKDITLDTDQRFRTLLKDAANQDPVMRLTQDQFFNSRYLAPACRAAEALGITSPLGQTVVYDSHIQGGWGTLRKRMGPVTARGEQDWCSGSSLYARSGSSRCDRHCRTRYIEWPRSAPSHSRTIGISRCRCRFMESPSLPRRWPTTIVYPDRRLQGEPGY
jgi:hypothetical protein